MDAKIQTLQKSSDGLRSQVDSLAEQVEKLQQKVIQLETLLTNSKYPLSDATQPLETSKTIQQKDYTFEAQKGLYLTENQIKKPTYHTKDIESKTLSYDPKIDFKASDTIQQYNLPLNQEKELNQHSFITLSNLSENDKIQIIKTGFQLNQQGKISLKKYYETTQKHSLFQYKGYSIKYETVRRTENKSL